jgi:CheY-like chemotaxis protein
MAHILIVDDDEMDRTLVRGLLAQEGHDTHVASDGDEALALCRGTPVDLVITDLQMPKVHGLELISMLRDLSPRPAIIAISGTGESQLDVASAVGADATLSKPISHDELLDTVRRALRALTLERS